MAISRLIAAAGALLITTAQLEAAQLAAPPPPKPPASAAPAKPVEPVETPPAEPVVQAPIELLLGRPIARIMINGQGPFAFLVDPTASRVLVDQTLVESLALKALATEPGTTKLEVHIDLGVGGSTLKAIAADVANVGSLVAGLSPAGQPRGVLSPSLWKDHLFTLDFGRRKLRIDAGALPVPNDKDIFALHAPSSDLIVHLRVNGQNVACRIDPMAPHGLLLPTSYLEQIPIQRPARVVDRIQLRGSHLPGREARITTKLTIATLEFDQPIAEFADIGDTAILGSRWLGDLAFTYDVANARVRIERIVRTNSW